MKLITEKPEEEQDDGRYGEDEPELSSRQSREREER
jgi:hypothetical protein